jgi:adenosylcobalamin-dependent ribonucleoside-triphosphate reductase
MNDTSKDMYEVGTPWSSVGYLTYKRTYARRLNENDINSPTEEFPDTVERVIKACDEQLKCGFTEAEEQRLRGYLLGLKGSVAGRFWWQLGTDTVDKLGLSSLQNCAFRTVDKPVEPFTWAMDMLMLGSGVGYNIQRENVNKLPPVNLDFKCPTRSNDSGADFIVPDSREGWVALLGKTLKAAFLAHSSGKQTFSYSTQLIRSKGAPIKGFGGTASGPEDLVWGIENISKVLEKRAGKQLRPVDCLDIMNIIGAVVVAGNVRRSAQIAIGDADDVEYLLAKRWDLGNIPSWRAMSNNSVVCHDIGDLHDFFWDGYEGKGEPYGLINLKLSRKIGRLGETQYPDPKVQGYNPCAEQSLADGETCCLAEVFLPNISSKEELLDVCTLLYRINKHSLALQCHQKVTEAIVHENMRMGIGITGVLQATEEQKSWLKETYGKIRAFDESYSKKHGFNKSIKLTTVKPSGTLSLLPGVTPGCHPAYARYMIRRIRISSNHALVQVCKDHGYHVEYQQNFDGSEDHSTVVVSFPFRHPDHAVLAKDMTAISQLETVKWLQEVWSDNSVSCTVYYRPEELPEIKKYLKKNYKTNHKSLSFLLHSEHGFKQAPLEEITEEQYNEMVANTRTITSIDEANIGLDDAECASGACPIR